MGGGGGRLGRSAGDAYCSGRDHGGHLGLGCLRSSKEADRRRVEGNHQVAQGALFRHRQELSERWKGISVGSQARSGAELDPERFAAVDRRKSTCQTEGRTGRIIDRFPRNPDGSQIRLRRSCRGEDGGSGGYRKEDCPGAARRCAVAGCTAYEKRRHACRRRLCRRTSRRLSEDECAEI